MSYGGSPSAFSDSDLNGLVDGHLEAGRRAELLRRLKSHDPERARVAAWRQQTDFLRASFSEIENETIPIALSLTPPPRLKCVTGNGWPQAKPSLSVAAPVAGPPRSRRSIVALVALIGCVAGFACLVTAERSLPPEPPSLVLSNTGLAKGMLVSPSFAVSESAIRDRIGMSQLQPVRSIHRLPTTVIPDLDAVGFRFTGATARDGDPAAIAFSYENATGEHLAVSVSKASATKVIDAPLERPVDVAITWQHHGSAYRLSGAPDRHRLEAIASALQASQSSANARE